MQAVHDRCTIIYFLTGRLSIFPEDPLGQTASVADDSSGTSFPIVGIGASAGGLNSLRCFLATLPKDFGFAVVFLQHLSTKHKSLLPELLHNRRPDIEINEIKEGMEVLSGKIYLCPPGMEVRLQKETFHVTLPSADHFHLPIDEFFVSLAEEAGERVIGVIFSGAGTDGARGIHAIRTNGGTVFVQEPATAEFPGMPLAAISTGQADGILPPEEIAREIIKLPGAAPPSPDTVITPEDFEAFFRLINAKTGYRFGHYKKSVVGRRIRRRMFLRGISSVRDYIKMVTDKDSEAASLASDLMIGVTSFFRDSLAWKALKIGVIRKFAAENEDTPIRVWAPACATGEEAYSVAMMLCDEFRLAGRKREIQVFATDVNDQALEKAREGKYPGSIAADVPPDFLRKYFTCSEDGLSVIISKEIRESVVIAKQDLLTDPPFSKLNLIICRNFLIYLEPEAQEKCLALFHYGLMDGGYLFLGNAESVGRNKTLFKSLSHKKCRIYQRIETRSSPRLSLTIPFAADRSAQLSQRQSPPAEHTTSVMEIVQETLLGEFAPAAIAINQSYDILYHNGPTNRYLSPPRGAPTQNLLELLPESLRNRVRGAIYRVTREAKAISIRANFPGNGENAPMSSLSKGEKKRGRPSAKGGRGHPEVKLQVTLRISKLEENLFLVVFREKGGVPEKPDETAEAAAVDETAVRQLEIELSATRQDLQNKIEQLKSLNEEMQSSNEELQAANEELETSREELQSLNEELITVNSQLQSKIEEQEETNNDLNNFLSSTNIPTVFLDHQFRVKRFTPAMSRLIKLIPSDVGRPIIDMSQEGLGPDLIADAQSVLDNLAPVRRELMISGAWYVRAALPYRTSDNRIEGVVIAYNDVTEVKEAEERTRHLASFPQLNPNPVIEVDSSGKITFSNPATQRILESVGMDKGEATVFLASDFEAIFRDWDKQNESSLYREVTVKDRVFGETVYLSPSLNVVRIYAYDITEIKKAEEIRGRLAAIVESADYAIISKDLNGIIQTWNVGAENIFGYRAGEVIGKPVSLLVPPGHIDEVPEILARLEQGEHIENIETVRVRKDGTIIPVSLKFSPIKDASGKVIGASKIAHDITERKMAEEALRESERRYHTLFQNMAEGFAYCKMVYDNGGLPVDFLYIDVNAAFENITGLRDVVGRKVTEAIPGIKETNPELFEIYGKVALTGQPERFEIEVKPLGMWLSVSAYSTEMEHFVAVFDDITERKHAEAELQRLNKAMKALSDSSQAVIREKDEQEYLDGVCRIIIEDCGYSMVWIGFAENDEAKSVRPVAHAGFGDGYLESLRISWADTEWGRGPTGTAIRTGKVAVCRNMLTDPAFAPWREQAVKRGYAASIVFPLHVDDRIIGAITIYSKEADPFSEGEVKLLAELADNLAHGIKVLRIRDAQEKAEESLKRSLARFELLSHTAEELLRTTEPQKVVESVCRKVMKYLDCHAFFNFLVDELTGKLHLNAFSGIPQDEAKRIEWLEFGVAVCGCAARDAERIIAEHIPTTPDERTELVKSYGIKAYCCHPLLGPGGKVIGTLSFGTCGRETFSGEDISLMKAVTDQVAVAMTRMRNEADVLKLGEDMAMRNVELETVNNELESFIYSISHDLRAPLRTMGGFAKIMKEDYSGSLDEQGRDYLRRIRIGSEKMTRLIDDLLNLSRISRQEISRVNVDLSKLARSVVSDFRMSDPGRNVDVVVAEDLFVDADHRLMEVVLSNLLGNAWKFTSTTEHARIEFGATQQDGKTIYYVRDNGAGFDPRYMEKMFWPFHRLHSDQEFEGTGIGLAIVERIIRRHGGKVWAEGEVGEGAAVYFTVGRYSRN